MRLDALSPEQMTTTQRELYEEIALGPRSKGPQLFPLTEPTGALTGPFGIMLHAPAMGRPLQELGAVIRYDTSLDSRIREIAILSVAADTSCAFETFAHERVGLAVGLRQSELTSLATGTFKGINDSEDAAYHLCKLLNEGRFPVSDGEYDDLRRRLGETVLIELVVLVGYYRTLAQLLNLFDVGLPAEG